jgi:protein-disulfide isomerase
LASRKEQREEARRQREEREAEERKKARRKRRLWQVGATLVVAIAVIVIVVLVASSGGSDQKVSKQETTQAQDAFGGIAQNGTTLGNPEAKVTLYEFADLQCPFCREYTRDGAFHQLVEKYVKPGKVKMEWRNLTFIGGDSVTAGRAAIAAGAQNRLWQFIDLFYANQGTENTGYVTDKFISDIATAAGVDVPKLNSDISAPFVEEQLATAQSQASKFGINSTPSFLIQVGNEKPQKLDYKDFKLDSFAPAIDAALKKAGSSSGSGGKSGGSGGKSGDSGGKKKPNS